MENNLPLTKNERLTLILSTLAVALSVLSPIATYLWLQDSVREQQLRARSLLVSGRQVLHNNDAPLPDEIVYSIKLFNAGPLPLDGVTLSLRGETGLPAGVMAEAFKWDPPWSIESEIEQGALLIYLERPLPPGQKIDIGFRLPTSKPEFPELNAWVSSSSSPSIPVVWAEGVVGSW